MFFFLPNEPFNTGRRKIKIFNEKGSTLQFTNCFCRHRAELTVWIKVTLKELDKKKFFKRKISSSVPKSPGA